MYGGAAGGGKTSAALMAAAQFVHVPGYSALLLRESFPDLNQADALIPRSKEWWKGTAASWNQQEKRWTFPCPGGGTSTITFGYLDCDDAVYQYQGAAFQTIYIDELTQHTEPRYRYLFSRLRKPKTGPLSTVPLRMRAGTNPGGRGHAWVFNRFVNPQTRTPNAVFVPARLEDNPSLDAEEYARTLAHLDPLTRAQLLNGDWNAVEGGRFKREWFPRYRTRGEYLLLQRPGEARERTYLARSLNQFITVDPNASAKTTSDFTVALLWAITPEMELVLLDGERFQAAIEDVVPRLVAFWTRHNRRPGGVWIEAVGANNGVYSLSLKTPMPARALNPLGLDKLVRATPAINLAATGRVWLPLPNSVPGMPLDDIEAEWYRFTGNDKQDSHDDAVDALSYGARVLGESPVSPNSREAMPSVLGTGR